jgi:hypothetical protein
MLLKVIDTNNYSKPSMPEIKFLTSDELRTLTQRATSFLQIEYLDEKKIPYTLDEYGTPSVRYDDVKYLLSISMTCDLLDGLKLKKDI